MTKGSLMGSKFDATVSGVNIVLKVVVSLIWGAGMVGGFATGFWIVGVIAACYLAYLWFFGGRWLIY